MTETTGQEVDIAQLEAKIAQLAEEKRAAHDAVASCEYLNMDIHMRRMKSGCEIVAIESFMPDKHQKMIDDSLDILKKYDEYVVSLAIAFKDHYSLEEKALLAQKAIMNDEARQVILSKIKDMCNAFCKTRIIINPTIK